MTDHGFTNEPTERFFNSCWDNRDTKNIAIEIIQDSGTEDGAEYLKAKFGSVVHNACGEAVMYLEWVKEQINFTEIAERLYDEAQLEETLYKEA